MRRLILSTVLSAVTIAIQAITPLWMRDVQISPDGKQIAFCYKGDIYLVPAEGGNAIQLTASESYEQTPVWSPDSKTIAFASDRYGNFDIFTISAKGGTATRLTFSSVAETPQTFTPDGRGIIFSASIQDPASSAAFPRSSLGELYSVPVGGGRTSQVLGTPALAVNYSPKGDFLLYQDNKGMESTWRKHHISSVTRDIWKYDIKNGTHTNLTNRPGEDLNPILGADGKTIFILSEPADGDGHPKPSGWQTSINVYSFQLDRPGNLTQVSSFKTHPVRFLSRGGDLLCYTWDGEIYTQVPGSRPKKVDIDLTRYDDAIPELKTQSSGAGDAAVSPDGKQM